MENISKHFMIAYGITSLITDAVLCIFMVGMLSFLCVLFELIIFHTLVFRYNLLLVSRTLLSLFTQLTRVTVEDEVHF